MTLSFTEIMETAVDKTKITVDRARNLNKSFEEINASFQEVTDMVHQIVTATEEQSSTVTEISTNLSGLAEDARLNAESVKEVMVSFNNFITRAKEFLRLLDGFFDPKLRIGIAKADYVMWLLRLTDLIDGQTTLFLPDEFVPEGSRMGKWYYEEGKSSFGDSKVFQKIEVPHRRLHEIGKLAYDASRNGDREAVKGFINKCVGVTNEILNLLEELEGI